MRLRTWREREGRYFRDSVVHGASVCSLVTAVVIVVSLVQECRRSPVRVVERAPPEGGGQQHSVIMRACRAYLIGNK